MIFVKFEFKIQKYFYVNSFHKKNVLIVYPIIFIKI